MALLDDLKARGLVADTTDEAFLAKLLHDQSTAFYLGIDPTANSIHLGTMVPIMLARHLQRAGHRPVLVVGGATAMIGDPSGKSEERNLLSKEQIASNVSGMTNQLNQLLSFEGPSGAKVTNNADWIAPISYLEFLRDVGKHLTINYMMAKDSVKSRLETREQGISYTEFSYMCLQAYDFVHLAKAENCQLQIGGSDQWGNITAGTELQRKTGGGQLAALTCPLLLDSSGKKMGKTASGEKVWLDADKTSPYAFYQYFLAMPDADAEKMFLQFSEQTLPQIKATIALHQDAPHQRAVQKALASEMTSMIHGEEKLKRVIAASQVLFGGSLDDLTDEDLAPLLQDVPTSQLSRKQLESGISLIELLLLTKLADSKGAAKRLIRGGGVYVSNTKCDREEMSVSRENLSTDTMLVIRAGKKKYHIITFLEN